MCSKITTKTEIPLVFPEGDQDGETKLFRIESERSNKTDLREVRQEFVFLINLGDNLGYVPHKEHDS